MLDNYDGILCYESLPNTKYAYYIYREDDKLVLVGAWQKRTQRYILVELGEIVHA